MWVTGWWFGCAEQQTEKLLVVTNKQLTTKKNIGDLMWCLVICSDARVRFVESCHRKGYSAPSVTNTKIMKMWTGCDTVSYGRYPSVLQDR